MTNENESLKRGLEQSARGEVVDLGDFTQYADNRNYIPDDKTVLDCFLDGAAGEFIEEDFERWVASVKANALREAFPEVNKPD